MAGQGAAGGGLGRGAHRGGARGRGAPTLGPRGGRLSPKTLSIKVRELF